ncbi:MAG: putative photosynthetic complex assembly protein PuhE [Pseudomonadota bacterium]
MTASTVTTYVVPALFAVGVWWFATGYILWLGRKPANSHVAGMITATVLALGGFAVLSLTANSKDTVAAYAAFTAAIAIWGWHELSFVYGFVTGPRRAPCPEGARGMQRFSLAFQTMLYHELAILVGGLLIFAMSLLGDNQVGLITYLILWAMRISAKLNLYFGVPNMAVEMMPLRLSYLASYFNTVRISAFFPVSVTLATLVLTGAIYAIATGMTESGPVTTTAAVLCTTLLALAVFEHWVLILPFNEMKLWGRFLGQDTSKPVATLLGKPVSVDTGATHDGSDATATDFDTTRQTSLSAPVKGATV